MAVKCMLSSIAKQRVCQRWKIRKRMYGRGEVDAKTLWFKAALSLATPLIKFCASKNPMNQKLPSQILIWFCHRDKKESAPHKQARDQNHSFLRSWLAIMIPKSNTKIPITRSSMRVSQGPAGRNCSQPQSAKAAPSSSPWIRWRQGHDRLNW